jgi:hypothetical protein
MRDWSKSETRPNQQRLEAQLRKEPNDRALGARRNDSTAKTRVRVHIAIARCVIYACAAPAVPQRAEGVQSIRRLRLTKCRRLDSPRRYVSSTWRRSKARRRGTRLLSSIAAPILNSKGRMTRQSQGLRRFHHGLKYRLISSNNRRGEGRSAAHTHIPRRNIEEVRRTPPYSLSGSRNATNSPE